MTPTTPEHLQTRWEEVRVQREQTGGEQVKKRIHKGNGLVAAILTKCTIYFLLEH